jgi:hypothetical protein
MRLAWCGGFDALAGKASRTAEGIVPASQAMFTHVRCRSSRSQDVAREVLSCVSGASSVSCKYRPREDHNISWPYDDYKTEQERR